MKNTKLSKTVEEALKNATNVDLHYGSLRVTFQEPNKPKKTKKSLRMPPTKTNIDLAVTTLANIKNDIGNGTYKNDPDKFWSTHFPTDPSNTRADISVEDCFEEYKVAKVNYISDSKFDKLKTALNWLRYFNLAHKDLNELTTERLERIRQKSVQSTKEELERKREVMFINKLEKEYGATFIKLMTESELNKLRNSFNKEHPLFFQGCSVSTVNEYTKSVKQVLDFAVKQKYIKDNPANDVEKLAKDTLKLLREDKDVRPFSQLELDSLLEVVHVPKVRLMIKFLAWTGMRPGELKALGWEEIDFDEGVINVKYNLTRKGNLKMVKTEAGVRVIELLPEALKVLKELKDVSYHLSAIEERIYGNNQKFIVVRRRRVFLSRDNQPYKRPELTTKPNQWANWLKEAKLSHRPSYQLRHSYASRLLMAGAKPLWLATQMGHKNVEMISKIYGKWIPKNEPDYIKRLAEKLGQSY